MTVAEAVQWASDAANFAVDNLDLVEIATTAAIGAGTAYLMDEDPLMGAAIGAGAGVFTSGTKYDVTDFIFGKDATTQAVYTEQEASAKAAEALGGGNYDEVVHADLTQGYMDITEDVGGQRGVLQAGWEGFKGLEGETQAAAASSALGGIMASKTARKKAEADDARMREKIALEEERDRIKPMSGSIASGYGINRSSGTFSPKGYRSANARTPGFQNYSRSTG